MAKTPIVIDLDVPRGGPFGLLDVDVALDDMCCECSGFYCKRCVYEGHCFLKTVEECPLIPCLLCNVFKVRRVFGLAVRGTTGL